MRNGLVYLKSLTIDVRAIDVFLNWYSVFCVDEFVHRNRWSVASNYSLTNRFPIGPSLIYHLEMRLLSGNDTVRII